MCIAPVAAKITSVLRVKLRMLNVMRYRTKTEDARYEVERIIVKSRNLCYKLHIECIGR